MPAEDPVTRPGPARYEGLDQPHPLTRLAHNANGCSNQKPRPEDMVMKHAKLAATISAATLLWQLSAAPAQLVEVGDTIQIIVLDDDSLSIPSVEIQEDGKIYHPLLGEIAVAGQDRVTLAKHIAGRLKQEIREPRVAVNIVRKRPLPTAYVLGEVNKPGPHPIAGTGTVREMLIEAGGMTVRAAANRVVIISAAGDRRVVDLGRGLAEPADPESTPIAQGDCIFVPAQNAVAVIGAVAQPGSVNLPDGTGLDEALAAAGGLALDADDRNVLLLRGGEKTLLSDSDPKLQLTEGDVVIVGVKEQPQGTVLGEVNGQGTYPMDGGSDVATLLAKAGGPTENADLSRVKLLRDTSPSVMLDIRELLATGASANNLPLRDGDTLIFPARLPERVTVWGMVQTPGLYDLDDSNRLLDVLAQAGGPTDRAEKRYVVVVKAADRVAHQVPLPTKRDIADGAKLQDYTELQDGDLVFVPGRGARLDWREALTALGLITLIADRAR